MIQFKLFDENNEDENGDYIEYSIDIDFEDMEEFDDWSDSSIFDKNVTKFELFMDDMEIGNAEYCGVHDYCGGADYVGFSSYEIANFPAAIEKWKEFFRNENKLIE